MAMTTSSGGPGFGATLRSEWTKIRSVRSTWTVLVVALVVGIGLSALFSLAAASGYESLPVEAKAGFDTVNMTMVGVNLALVLFGVFGVLVVAPEYASGMVRLTLAVTPNRRRVLNSKIAIVAGISFVLGVVVAVLAFVLGQAIMAGSGAPTAGLGDPGIVRGLIGWGLEMAAFSLIALSLGVLLRSAAGAIATTLAIIFAPLVFGRTMPVWAQEHILRFLPGNAAEHLSSPHAEAASKLFLEPGAALIVLGAWVLAFVVISQVVSEKRDSG